MTLEQLRQKLEELTRKASELSAKTVGEDGNVRSFSEEEKSSYDALIDQAKNVREAIARLEALEEQNREVERLNAPSSRAPKVEVKRNEDEDEHGNYRGFRSLGEQLQAVYRSGLPGERSDERLAKIRAASGMNETVDSEGGFLVQSDFMVEMIRDIYNEGDLAKLCRRIPISSPSNALEIVTVDETSRADGSRYGGVQAYWRAEAATVTATKPKLKNMRIALEDLMAIGYATGSLLEDAPALEAIMKQAFVEELAFKLDVAIVEGDGAGKPLGILNSGALIEVTKETSQTADTIEWANVANQHMRMTKKGRSRGVWLYNNDASKQIEALYVPLGSSNGLPVFQPAGAWGNELPSLYSRPLIEAEACPTLGDMGDLVFADLKEYALIEKSGIDAQTSIHVRFLYDENTFRVKLRCNGQPLVSSAVTPYKGSVTRSPFVAIAERA